MIVFVGMLVCYDECGCIDVYGVYVDVCMMVCVCDGVCGCMMVCMYL